MDRMIYACEIVKYIKNSCWPSIVRMEYRVDNALMLINNIHIDHDNPYALECIEAIKHKFDLVRDILIHDGGDIVVLFK